MADALDSKGSQGDRHEFSVSSYAVVTSDSASLMLRPILLHFCCTHFTRIAFAQPPACANLDTP